MLAMGTLSLILTELGVEGKVPGGLLVLLGVSFLLPNEEKTAKIGLAVASVVLAVAFLAGPLL
jgi:hypothetical protein